MGEIVRRQNKKAESIPNSDAPRLHSSSPSQSILITRYPHDSTVRFILPSTLYFPQYLIDPALTVNTSFFSDIATSGSLQRRFHHSRYLIYTNKQLPDIFILLQKVALYRAVPNKATTHSL